MTFYFLLMFPSSSGVWKLFSIFVTHWTFISLYFCWSQSRNTMILQKNINDAIYPKEFLYAKYVAPYLVTRWLIKKMKYLFMTNWIRINYKKVARSSQSTLSCLILTRVPSLSEIIEILDHNLLTLFSCFNWQWYLYLYFFHSQKLKCSNYLGVWAFYILYILQQYENWHKS